MADEDDKVEPATLDLLLDKPPAERTVIVTVNGRRLSLRLRAIGGPAYDALERKHPPSLPEDQDRFGRPLLFNPRTFPPALVAACLVEPVLSEDETLRIWDSPTWSKGDLNDLFGTAYELNHASDVEQMGKGSGPTQ